MKFNDKVFHKIHGNGTVKGFSKDSKTVYIEFTNSKALIPLPKNELEEVKI